MNYVMVEGPNDALGIVWAASEFLFIYFISYQYFIVCILTMNYAMGREMESCSNRPKRLGLHASFGPKVSFFFFLSRFIKY